MIAVVMTGTTSYVPWTYDRSSSEAASPGRVRAPTDGVGRWIRRTATADEVSAAQATADAGIGVVHRTVTIDVTADDFANLGAGVKTFAKAFNLGALAANSRYAGHAIGSGTFVGFTNGGGGAAYTLTVGGTDVDEVVATADVAAGQTGFPKIGTPGVKAYFGFTLLAEVINVTLTSDADLNTATGGTVTLDLFTFAQA